MTKSVMTWKIRSHLNGTVVIRHRGFDCVAARRCCCCGSDYFLLCETIMRSTSLRLLRSAQYKLLPSVAAAYLLSESSFLQRHDNDAPQRNAFFSSMSENRVLCDAQRKKGSGEPTQEQTPFNIQKRATLRKASDVDPSFPARRYNTAQALDKLRPSHKETLLRWERDEDGWRELPARAWPAFQPNEEQMEVIRQTAQNKGCNLQATTSWFGKSNKECQELFFQISTTLVFYNVDAKAGLEQFKQLAEKGHVDSMVACGVILVEGLGVPPNEEEGIEWLKKAADLGSNQATYELGTVYYTGIADVLQEDPEKAYTLFERAAQTGHVAAMYMMADCLAEGEGVAQDMAKAVPLFYAAAEQGHRFARQRIRELLASRKYKA
eukprot:scaffold1953_cov176-Amphora_coffeaeformis.AAC.43